MNIKKLWPVLVLAAVLLTGCTMTFDGTDETSGTPSGDAKFYQMSNGYSLYVPQGWTMEELDQDTVRFTGEDERISMTITTELGGIDYYSMREIKEQLTEKIAAEMFASYDIDSDSGGTKYFRRILKGTDQDGAGIVVDLYASQPFSTVRHYVVTVASASAYKAGRDEIESVVSSFTPTFSNEEYLQLMQERRDAEEAALQAEEQAASPATEENGANESETGE